MILNKIISKLNTRKYGWFGNFSSWEEAVSASEGYDSSFIVNKVKNATLKVKNGEAAFERDSVLFAEKEYSWPLLSALLLVAAQNKGKLRLVDFGGSLGSTYFQYKHLLKDLEEVKWHIVEQENYYKIGKDIFEDKELKFSKDLIACLENNEINAVLFGCVLPYVSQPYEIIKEVFHQKVPFIFLDRMPFIAGPEDRLTVQKVPPEIYQASYPAWFFSYQKFMSFISKEYDLVAEYECDDKANIKSQYKGLILKIKE
jgi:putative methyltransferase (TIGR04325 family)